VFVEDQMVKEMEACRVALVVAVTAAFDEFRQV